MTDQMIPADKVREIIHANTFRRVVLPHCRASIIDQLEALLSRHSLPTLADMTDEERAACVGMQATVRGDKCVILDGTEGPGGMWPVLWRGTMRAGRWRAEMITPRPDLPRMTWPGTGQGADQDGEEVTKVDYVSVEGGGTEFGPWTFARLPKKADQ